jgi:hypothetical protein
MESKSAASSSLAPIHDSVEVRPEEFPAYHLRALGEVACGRAKGPFHLIMASLPGTGLALFLRDAANPVHTVRLGPAPTTEREIREFVFNADEAWEALLKILWSTAPQIITEVFDKVAATILQDVFAATAEVVDAIWLIRWIKFRAECPRLGFDEAQRLYGSTPALDLSGEGPIIDWEELSALIGADAGFEHRKRITQRLFEEELNDALERFAGGVNAAFLSAWTKRAGS